MEMVIEERRQTQTVRPSSAGSGSYYIRRGLSWSGIWAGAFAAMALQLTCGLLGVWANSSAIVLGGQVPIAGIPAGVGVWYLIYTIAALFVGGLVASQQSSGAGSRMLHALGAWAVASVVGFYTFAILGNRMTVGLSAPGGGLLGAGQVNGISLVSPGWFFGGLVIGLAAALLGAVTSSTVADA